MDKEQVDAIRSRYDAADTVMKDLQARGARGDLLKLAVAIQDIPALLCHVKKMLQELVAERDALRTGGVTRTGDPREMLDLCQARKAARLDRRQKGMFCMRTPRREA